MYHNDAKFKGGVVITMGCGRIYEICLILGWIIYEYEVREERCMAQPQHSDVS